MNQSTRIVVCVFFSIIFFALSLKNWGWQTVGGLSALFLLNAVFNHSYEERKNFIIAYPLGFLILMATSINCLIVILNHFGIC